MHPPVATTAHAKAPRKIRLRIGIAMMFLAVVVPLTVAMVAVLFQQNARLARDMADQSMAMAEREAVGQVQRLVNDFSTAVALSTAFSRVQKDARRQPEALRPLLEELQRLPQAYSLHFSALDTGDHYQVVRLNAHVRLFGPHGVTPPEGARWVLRRIETVRGQRVDSYQYLAAWGQVLKTEKADASFDPRSRPWFEAALQQPGTAVSDVYLFAGTGRPGMTLSRQVRSDSGVLLGVFGADLSLATLADFLQAQAVGRSGTTFVLDEQHRLIGYPDLSQVLIRQSRQITLVTGEAVANPAVAAATTAYFADTTTAVRKFAVQAAGQTWLAHFSPLPDTLGRQWTLGVVVAEDDFVGPVKHASLVIVGVGLAFIVLSTAGIVWMSRVLVHPIQQLIGETERIRDFQLEAPLHLRSSVHEIDALASAVASMKTGLASFGAYVPKSLVHNIIRSGVGTGVGGQRLPLTVMFTDLQGFTEATEKMAPEQVLLWLSEYFNRMTQAVQMHQGTIDKYIGDSVMGLWNAPVPDADHVAHACRAALACRAASRTLGFDGTGPRLRTRIGLHTGMAMVGNVGSQDRMQYTAMGAMVNLASRVEGLNKAFGTELLVTQAIVDGLGAEAGQFHFRPFGPVLVAGATLPLAVLELRDDTDGLALWMQAWAAWQAHQWVQAETAFSAYARQHPQDRAAPLFLARVQAFRADGPPPGWDGVLRFNSK